MILRLCWKLGIECVIKMIEELSVYNIYKCFKIMCVNGLDKFQTMF